MKNQRILITGGSSGIGLSAAKELHQLGASIIIQARNLEKLESAAKEIDPKLDRVAFYSTDLGDLDAVQKSAELIVKEQGVPDVIINSAGAGEWLSFTESTPEHFPDTINSPYVASASTSKVFFDYMKLRGTGHFIFINSAACYFSFPGATGYLPSRWALLGFANSLHMDLYDTNFNVSHIAFGKVSSPYFANNPISEERIPKIAIWLNSTLTPDQAGHEIVRLVKSPKRSVIRPRTMSLFVFLNRLLPGLFRWLMRLTSTTNN